MSDLRSLGMGVPRLPIKPADRAEYVVLQHALRRVLEFTGLSIDDVVNNPIARNRVRGYYKLHKFVQRRIEIVDLERDWNPLSL